MEEADNKTDRSVPWRRWGVDPIWDATALTFVLFAVSTILFNVTLRFYKSQVEFGLS
jgi:hypothetical protein